MPCQGEHGTVKRTEAHTRQQQGSRNIAIELLLAGKWGEGCTLFLRAKKTTACNLIKGMGG
ncbi:MAG: hypothetical protein LKH78_02325 [Weizmannia coagulans]|jgi:hypothetical protein|uniref:Uncharacterized protein n=1 Tax=Heyndrickxia coagulans TaxID=1398 RepID=A0AAN0T700_HEYCO|nr:hypothetical protein [Heyndrickxia coagulans]KGT37455.1 hypothetical protein P421_15185 [Heyndrickxia coagulans P38]NWN95226.1 hypothetical protein [Bacillus sp. (in: firmicutes)]AJO24057.1 hypothetical protein SB48_HM08orf05222 [Heyndrickxia coagulans]AKN54465.1 hypothetical protein AB434_2060 [Heyndrickxia coagulans]APB35397.1 hypothetical protein BIZ35_00385 [Heyndrickxia coagulans]